MTREPLIGRILRLAEAAAEFGAGRASQFSTEHWALIRDLGWVTRSGQAARVSCEACEDGHDAEVRTDTTGLWHLCLSNGRINLTPDAVALYRADREAVLAALTHAAGLSGQAQQSYSGGSLIRLGFLKSAPNANGWCIGYAALRGADAPDAAVLRALEADYPRGPGLLLVSAADIEPRTLPRQHRLTPIDLVFELDEQMQLRFHPERVISQPRPVQRAVPGSPLSGSASDNYACAAGILGRIHGTPDWPKLRPDQSVLLLEHWPDTGLPKPSVTTVPGYILRYEREHGLESPRRGRPKSARRI